MKFSGALLVKRLIPSRIRGRPFISLLCNSHCRKLISKNNLTTKKTLLEPHLLPLLSKSINVLYIPHISIFFICNNYMCERQPNPRRWCSTFDVTRIWHHKMTIWKGIKNTFQQRQQKRKGGMSQSSTFFTFVRWNCCKRTF